MSALGVLYNPLLPQGSLLDAIKFSETGHLSPDAARTAVSRAGAVGPYQFMQKFLPDFGYGMPKDIPLSDVQDTKKSRQLADQFVTGYSNYHNFETPIEKLVAYNAGPNFAAKWKAAGARIADLPAETQKYVQKAAAFLTRKGNDDMAYLGMPSETDPNRTIDGQVISPAEEARRVIAQNLASARAAQAAMRANAPTMNISAYPPGFTMASPPPAQPMMAMPSEDNAALNIDGSQVGDDALLATIPSAMRNFFSAGANAQPQNAPPPAALNTGAYSPDAVLQQVMGVTPAAASTAGPALSYSSTPSRSTGSGQVSQNRRDMSAMSLVPSPQQIGLNEMLIRMGGAGVRGAAQGGLESIGAMTDVYGQIQDANRANGLAAYQAQMEALSKGKDTKQDAKDQQQIGQIDQTLFDMDRALGLLQEGGVTGPFDAYVADVFDRAAGSPDRASRLLLQKLRVDDAMLRVAQTKGAISNKEMELFLAPAPSLADQEDVWIEWIRSRQEALRQVRSRLSTGTSVADPASAAQVDQFTQQGQGGSFADADAIVGIN